MLTQQITALSRQWVDQKDGGQFSSTSHLLLGRKWKHNWSKILQMPQTSAFHFQQLKATSAHVSNHTLPVALLLAWDIWKVSSTGDRIPHPASTQQMHSATESHLPQHLWCHMSLTAQTQHTGESGWDRCQGTNYRISSAAAAQNRYLHLPYFPLPLFIQIGRRAASFPGLGSRRFLADWQIEIKIKISLRAALNEMDFIC